MKKAFLFIFLFSTLLWSILYLAPISGLNEDETFAPVNSQYYTCGDVRFYYAGVVQTASNFFRFKAATGSTDEGTLIDKSRITLYRLAAVLSLFIEDKRIGFIVSSFLSFLFTCLLISYLVYKFSASSLLASAIPLIFMFFLNAFRELFGLNYESARAAFETMAFNSYGTNFIENFNDNFRFLVLMQANLFICCSFILAYFLLNSKKTNWVLIGTIVLFYLATLYTYASVVGYVFVIMGAVILQKTSIPTKKNYFISFGLFLASGLIFGIFSDLLQVYSKLPPAISQSHFANKPVLSPMTNFYGLLILTGMYLLARRLRLLITPFTLALGLVMLIQLGALLLGFNFYPIIERFYIRGGISFIFITTLLFICEVLAKLKTKHKFTFRTLTVLLFLVSVLPLKGSINAAQAFKTAHSFGIKKELYNAYEWIKHNVKKDQEVLALDIQDIQLLPVLTAINLTVAGAEYLRSPEVEVSKIKFFSTYLGIENGLTKNLQDYFKVKEKLTCAPLNKQISFEESKNVLLFDQIIYYPFIQDVAHNLVSKNGNFTDEFIEYMKAPATEIYNLPQFIITDTGLNLTNNQKLLDNYHVVFKNIERTIFSRKNKP